MKFSTILYRYILNCIYLLKKSNIIPFSERKGYTAVKKCLKLVCPSQSETSFSILCLFDVLIKLCYRLSMSINANPRSDFPAELPLVKNSTNQK